MARTLLSSEKTLRTGLNATYTAAIADGHYIRFNKSVVLHVKQGTGARVVTIPTAKTVDGLAVADQAVTVPDSGERFIGPFTEDYQQSDGTIWIDYDATTNTTIAVLEVTP